MKDDRQLRVDEIQRRQLISDNGGTRYDKTKTVSLRCSRMYSGMGSVHRAQARRWHGNQYRAVGLRIRKEGLVLILSNGIRRNSKAPAELLSPLAWLSYVGGKTGLGMNLFSTQNQILATRKRKKTPGPFWGTGAFFFGSGGSRPTLSSIDHSLRYCASRRTITW